MCAGSQDVERDTRCGVTLEDRHPGVRAAALSGFLMTLLYIVLSIFPIIDVPNPWLFTGKVVAVVGGLECAGTAYYWRATRPLSDKE